MYMSVTKRWRSRKPVAERWRKIIPRLRDVTRTTFHIRVSWAVVDRAKALGISAWPIPYDANVARKKFQLFPTSFKEPKPFSAPSSTASACVSAPIGTPCNELRETYDVSRCRKTYMGFNKGTPTGVPATTETATLGPNLQTTATPSCVSTKKIN